MGRMSAAKSTLGSAEDKVKWVLEASSRIVTRSLNLAKICEAPLKGGFRGMYSSSSSLDAYLDVAIAERDVPLRVDFSARQARRGLGQRVCKCIGRGEEKKFEAVSFPLHFTYPFSYS
ncbi:hypothetical protein MKZ38_008670 [Zalerion maritima]|uniref:Uncharacterized protein n=1 Tax=Zalerion maritima TaxID=339359 RepID=A0AAD5WNJ3_9PEZI|nr:hypothetical protein MKZ38_008670 [Zalerion maritima]